MTKNATAPLSFHLFQSGILPRNKSDEMKRKNLEPISPLFLTMIDSSYIPAARVFHAALEKYHLDGNLIVICLDDPCVKLAKVHNLMVATMFINSSVAKVKVI